LYFDFFDKSLLVSEVSESLFECDRLRIRAGGVSFEGEESEGSLI